MSARPPASTFSTSASCVASPHSKPVLAQDPDIAGNSDRGLLRLRHRVFVGQALGRLLAGRQDRLHFLGGEPDQVEIEAVFLERCISTRSISSSHPALSRQLVVGQHQRAALRFGEVSRTMTGTSVIPSLRAASRRAWPAMIDAIGADQNRIRPAKLDDAGATWATCSSVVRARVPGVGNQLLDRPRHHLQVRHGLLG